MKAATAEPSFIRPGIILLALATALIHLSLNVVIGQFDIMFTLNGLVYLSLLAGLFLDLPFARDHRQWIRLAMIAFTGVTILAWIILGDKSWWLGWLTKVDEVLLIALLLIKRP